ncbi:MAG TPA: serine/threonine-protein kinase, partial [Nitrososphaera sp.]|nr:serine/threonine-protein kinase [Nitrososphaera sp.]
MAEEFCNVCHKKIRSGRIGSLTQWLLAHDVCACNSSGGLRARNVSNKNDRSESADPAVVCPACGKLQGNARDGSLTQWIFSGHRCTCPINRFESAEGKRGTAYSTTAPQTNDDPRRLPAEVIERLESEDIDYHQLSADSFPFHRYRIIKEVGRGFSGVVYDTWDCALKKRVAVKILHNELFSGDELMRFQKEAKAAARFNHPNLVQVMDFGAAPNGQPYMVMEFAHGQTLKDIVDTEGPLAVSESIVVFLQVCEAMQHAHSQGILHRDLKSTNIIVARGRELVVKVIDFGIAALRQATTVSKNNQSLTIVGTPLYM